MVRSMYSNTAILTGATIGVPFFHRRFQRFFRRFPLTSGRSRCQKWILRIKINFPMWSFFSEVDVFFEKIKSEN